jgi:hypothetical protein
MRNRIVSLFAFTLLSWMAASLSAQYTTTSLGGTVADASSAAVPEAKVTVRNADTSFTQTTITGPAGAFLFPRFRE